MHAPAVPGRYVVEIDVVHEGITWFAGKGSHTLRVSIEVTSSAASSPAHAPPTMNQY